VNQGEYYNLPLHRVLVRGGTVNGSRFLIYFLTEGAVRSPVNIYIQEDDVAMFLSLHGEMYVGLDTVPGEAKSRLVFHAMAPDHIIVINGLRAAVLCVSSLNVSV
jgi:hypothetical protein